MRKLDRIAVPKAVPCFLLRKRRPNPGAGAFDSPVGAAEQCRFLRTMLRSYDMIFVTPGLVPNLHGFKVGSS